MWACRGRKNVAAGKAAAVRRLKKGYVGQETRSRNRKPLHSKKKRGVTKVESDEKIKKQKAESASKGPLHLKKNAASRQLPSGKTNGSIQRNREIFSRREGTLLSSRREKVPLLYPERKRKGSKTEKHKRRRTSLRLEKIRKSSLIDDGAVLCKGRKNGGGKLERERLPLDGGKGDHLLKKKNSQ